MGIVPDTRLGKNQFDESHLDAWASNAVSIGLTTVQVTTLGELTGEARKAYDDAELARLASKTATQAFYDAVRAMHNGSGAGADMIDAIRLKAQNTNDPNVYTLAQIPPPAPPGTTPPPGIPFAFTVGVLQDGSVELKWKCVNPRGTQGTIYEVKRAIGGGDIAPLAPAVATTRIPAMACSARSMNGSRETRRSAHCRSRSASVWYLSFTKSDRLSRIYRNRQYDQRRPQLLHYG